VNSADRSLIPILFKLTTDDEAIYFYGAETICSQNCKNWYKTRIGFFVERAEVISNLFFQQFHAIQSQQTSFSLFVNMPNGIDDLELLNNILNEVCNGIRIANFQETIGFSIEKVKAMLNELNLAINENGNKFNQSNKDTKMLLNQINSTDIKELFLLQTKGYQLLFYLRSLTKFPGQLGIILVLNIMNISGEISLKSPPKSIHINQLKNFLGYLENHIENLNKVDYNSPCFLECQNVFRSQALAETTSFDGKECFTLRVMINLEASEYIKSETTTYIGAEALASVEDIEAFTASMKASLAKFDNSVVDLPN